MRLDSLHDVLTECVRDLYNAETQLVKALPKMAKAASSDELKAALAEHLEQTRNQIERLDQVCELLGAKTKGKTCHAMKGLIEEGAEVIALKGSPDAKDAALIGAAQKIEHYEIAGYGTARTFAALLGEDEVAALLQSTLDEENAADQKLTGIAESGLNQKAADEDGDEADSEEGEDDARPAAKSKAKKR
ncbi:MAG: ferritin-like domain-containing protein [Gemmataceae bacterium]|nr:ferritin-like domain-containing protein [Gemmataceae bacterium]